MRPPITQREVDELLAFREPLRGFDTEQHQVSPELIESAVGFATTPATYPTIVECFFGVASRPWWDDSGYSPEDTGAMIEDDRRIDNADIDDLRAMLPWCVRGERFCDGHWGEVITSGRIDRILKRLSVLRASFPA